MKAFLIATTAIATGSAAWAFAASDDHQQGMHDQGMTDQEMTEEVQDNPADGRDFRVEYWDDTDQDRTPFTDDHSWIDVGVYSTNDIQIGDVERVRLDANGDVDAIVVEHGGFLEVGGRETLISDTNFNVNETDDGTKVVLDITATEFEAMLPFDEDRVSDYPLSDNDAMDDELVIDEPSDGDDSDSYR